MMPKARFTTLKAAQKAMVQMERRMPIGNNQFGQQGFTYIGVLVIVAVMMMALGAASQIWHTVMQREKEQELLFIGHQFRAAIGKYYAQSGGRYPASLESLLEANDLGVSGSGAKKSRFLRKLYKDPMTGESDWGLVAGADKKIIGIYSLSEEKPYKSTGFITADADLELAETYSDWKFVYVPKPRGQSAGGLVNGIPRPEPRPR
jgi:type II secretory pathway pseudopilin PulG